ncbi:MAG: hypothetical protein SVZ03_02220 [Spirochaetota bacterium]|nr:hypothetical protein [Spirochaetota bacterium]
MKTDIYYFSSTKYSLTIAKKQTAVWKDQIKLLDASFKVDDNSNGCGICKQICPINNTTLEDGRLVWHHNCQFCLVVCSDIPKKTDSIWEKGHWCKTMTSP